MDLAYGFSTELGTGEGGNDFLEGGLVPEVAKVRLGWGKKLLEFAFSCGLILKLPCILPYLAF